MFIRFLERVRGYSLAFRPARSDRSQLVQQPQLVQRAATRPARRATKRSGAQLERPGHAGAGLQLGCLLSPWVFWMQIDKLRQRLQNCLWTDGCESDFRPKRQAGWGGQRQLPIIGGSV